MDPRRLNKILGVIIVILVVGLGYFFIKTNNQTSWSNTASNNREVEKPSNVSSTVIPGNEAEENNENITSEQTKLLTYTNTKFNFEFKYPDSWQLANCPSCKEPDQQASSISFSKMGDTKYATFDVDVITVANCKTAKACTEANRKVITDDEETSGLKTYTLGNESGYTETINRPTSGGWRYRVYYFLKNRNLYVVRQTTKADEEATVLPALEEILLSFKITSVEPTAFKVYSDSKLGFSISYPAEENVRSGAVQNGVRIENLPVNRPDNYKTSPGDFYIEVYTQEGTIDCAKEFSSTRKVTVDGVDGLRGPANPGPYNGYRYLLCFNRAGKNYLVSVTEGDDRQDRPKSILDSFRFLAL